MSDDDKVGYGKPPVKTRFQKGQSGNPSGRPRRRNRPEEPLDFLKGLIAEFTSPITINEAGNRKEVTKWQALLKAAYGRALDDPAMMKFLITLMVKLPKEAVVDDEVYTYRVTPSTLDLWERIEQDVATWPAFRAKQQIMPPAD